VTRSHRSANAWLDSVLRCACPPDNQDAYWRLVRSVRASNLLAPVDRSAASVGEVERIIQAVGIAACHVQRWVRTPESWPHSALSRRLQWRSLVTHLFALYAVPAVACDTWLEAHGAPWERDLFFHLSAGLSLRRFLIPDWKRPTKAAAAHFLGAPADLCLRAALRWAQVRGLGGDDRLARYLATHTLLGIITDHHDYWETVIRFLIRNQPMSTDELGQIVTYVQQQRFGPASGVRGVGASNQPLQPDLHLDGWSLQSLRRHIANWRPEPRPIPLPGLRAPSTARWEPIPASGFRLLKGDILWSIEELLTGQDLQIEGHVMHHCVARYIGRCVRRESSIWMVKMSSQDRTVRVMTIEVAPATKAIVQVKGRKNAPPTAGQAAIVRSWATQEGLSLPVWLR
jgi:hypothetical protein